LLYQIPPLLSALAIAYFISLELAKPPSGMISTIVEVIVVRDVDLTGKLGGGVGSGSGNCTEVEFADVEWDFMVVLFWECGGVWQWW
jgi:hypothetical protein